jgi:arginine/lysine/ornithine decarboxylase
MSGFTGEELAQVLSEYRIECEFTDPDFLVLMASTENGPEDFERLKQAFSSIDPRSPIPQYVPKLPQSCMIFSARKAILAPSETLSLDAAAGRVCASPTVACPPAVPIVMSGEEITEEHIRVMRYYGYKHIDVIKSEG